MALASSWGLSPRVRGNLAAAGPVGWGDGSIPARAGEPRRGGASRLGRWVYPRACGGTGGAGSTSWRGEGLSPRVRGNPLSLCNPDNRSIPARAGEPRSSAIGTSSRRVYPRACGGTGSECVESKKSSGLSPRVRGNPLCLGMDKPLSRSIPARAGEPYRVSVLYRDEEVYPRACGGTVGVILPLSEAGGLSPRVRGNRGRRLSRLGPMGSIPARAGEPQVPAYIRGSGGGLSPRVRGNPAAPTPSTPDARSIPARAGEPAAGRRGRNPPSVYPRACGGTRLPAVIGADIEGLSPRVRGNHAPRYRHDHREGSIPARAGEPMRIWTPTRTAWVYPRACGGTAHSIIAIFCHRGLSPRVRGNQSSASKKAIWDRSIPARAGNRLVDHRDDAIRGSIPARAGEPWVS